MLRVSGAVLMGAAVSPVEPPDRRALPYLGRDATMTEYSSAARRQILDLQAVIDAHPVDAATDRCVACNVKGPCLARRDALYALAVRFELPHRNPGATRPQHINAVRVQVA